MPEHQHEWQVARVEQVGTFGPYVYFGCRCGEAIRSLARDKDEENDDKDR